MEEIEPAIGKVMDNVITGLTRPLTAEETSPKPKEIGDSPEDRL